MSREPHPDCRATLGDYYTERLLKSYQGRVPAEADLVCYWFEKAWQRLLVGKASGVGLVATNSIRGGANRRVLEPIVDSGSIFDAWDDEPWVIDGAAVRVSLVCFSAQPWHRSPWLDGLPVDRVFADLTGGAIDLTRAKRLPENAGVAFMGDTKGGSFDVPGELAREWLRLPLNPNGRPNSDVLRPWVNGMDIVRRPAGKWIIDFGWKIDEASAAHYEAPFGHLIEHVSPVRSVNKRETYRRFWWRHVEPRQGMW